MGSWELHPPEDATGWRHIRIRTTGPNSSGSTHYLSISGLELYGEIRSLADEDLGKRREREREEGEGVERGLCMNMERIEVVKEASIFCT